MPEEAFEKCIALPLLVRFRFEVVTAPVLEAEEEFLMDTQETYEMWERRMMQDADAHTLEQLEDKLLFANSLDELFAS